MAPPGTVTAASSPLPSRTRGPGRRQPLPQLRQQLELAHRLTIPAPRPRGDAALSASLRCDGRGAAPAIPAPDRRGRGPVRNPPAAQQAGAPGDPARARGRSSSASSSSRSSTSGRRSRAKGVHFHVALADPGVHHPARSSTSLSALGWDLILRFLGYRIGIGRAQVAWGQPLLARYVPGSVLYVLGRVLLSERAGVPRRITLASIVYEQAISATSAIVVASYFIISHPDLQGQPLRWAVLLLIPAAIAILHPRVFGPLANRVLRRLRPRAAAGGDLAARGARADRLLLADLGRGRASASTASPARSPTSPSTTSSWSARRRRSATSPRW